MADKTDGSITIDTEIDSNGFKAGSAELLTAIKSLSTAVKNLGPTFQNAVSGSESAMTSFEGKAGTLESRIAELQEKLEAVGQTRFPTQQYQDMIALLEKADYKADALRERMKTLDARGVSHNSQQWKNLQADIDRAAQKCDTYADAIRRMEADGSAFQVGADTTQYAQLESALSEASARLNEMREGTQQSEGFMSRLAGSARNVASFIGKAAKSAAGTLVSGIKAAASSMARMLFHSKKMNSQFGGLISGAKKFALRLLGARGVYALLRKAVSAYMAENQQLSNTLSACWSGIGNLLGPIITRIINLVAQAVSYVTTFLKLFGVFGKSTTKAINSAGGTASKATDKLKRQLAAFDELNILSDNSSGSGGDGGNAAGSLPDVELPDWAKLMVDQIKAGDWAKAAKTLTRQLNGMIAGVDWASIGNKIGYYLNGALAFLATALLTFDWYALGTDLAAGINRIIYSVDWASLGTLLAGKFRAIILTAGGVLLNLDWSALAKGFSSFAVNFFSGVSDALTALDWQQIGNNVATFVASIDWSGVADAMFDCIGAALGGLAAFIQGLIEPAWNSVVDWWHENALDDGEFTMSGLLEGIWNGIKNIGTWIYEHIFKPFIEGFKSAFGIASPSKVMAEQGIFLISGLLQGVVRAWKKIPEIFNKKLSGLVDTIQNMDWADVGWNICRGIADGIMDGWNWLKEKISNLAGGLVDAVENVLDINSPSRVFRDEVGLNIGYGIGEGVEASQPSILKSVSGVADAIADEFNAGDYQVGNIVPTSEVDGALSSFSDKISGNFTDLLDRIQAIADNITFAVPAVAGGVVPYKAAAAVASGGGADIGTTIETSNDELASVVTQVVANATASIVTAIRDYGGSNVTFDRSWLGDCVIQEINRRTRANGKSPLK